METNRERYIDSASNRTLAILLANKSVIKINNEIDVYTDERKDVDEIEQWLSQEVEEIQKENDIITLPMPEDRVTRMAVERILFVLRKMSVRLNKLEKSIRTNITK